MSEAELRAAVAAEVYEGTPVPEELDVAEGAEKAEVGTEVVEEDPWAGVSPALRSQFDEMSQKLSGIEELGNRLKTTEGRVGALQSELAKKAAREVKGDDAPSSDQIDDAASGTDAEWEQLKEDYPEWATALDRKISATRADLRKSIPDLEELRAELSQGMGAAMRQVDETLVAMRHPDFEEVTKKKEFWDWVGTQPDNIKELADSARPLDAIKILDAYKEAMKDKAAALAASRKKRLSLSAEVPRTPRQPLKSEADMDEKEIRAQVASEIWEN